MQYVSDYINEAIEVLNRIDKLQICGMVELLQKIREQGGRLFFIGVGGGAGNCSHAVNDFRKIAGIEAYAPTDNVSELTARTNDEGWDTVFVEWLRGCKLGKNDGVFVFSVGGGDSEKGISTNIVAALKYAKAKGARILGVVGRSGGYTAASADACVIIPNVNPANVTAHTEAFQAVIWHMIVSHPEIMVSSMKWESIDRGGNGKALETS